MTPEIKPDDHPVDDRQAAKPNDEDRRVHARRRFLRLGAGGSAALVVTVVHKRAFAGIKKNVIASACTSLQGVPDLKHANQKKALETSAMGTPKGLICRERPGVKTKEHALGSCTPTERSRYYEYKGGLADNTKVLFVKESELAKGCGSILPDAMPPNNTVSASYNFRLYQKGYCPIVPDGAGGLKYDLAAKYYTSPTDFVGTFCEKP